MGHASPLLLTAAGGGASPNPLVSLLPILAMVAIIYLLLIRPQQKEQQRHRKMIEGLRKGDEVITMGGIYGRIVALDRDKVTLRISENTTVVLERSKVAKVRTKEAS